MSDVVKLVGLDFGTTTSSGVIATAQLTHSVVTGRVELNQIRECYRSDLIFTPLHDDGLLDVEQLERHVDAWLSAGDVQARDVFGGGALLTGLTAKKENAAALVQMIRGRLGNALVATADDPCLESWLAFMGSCASLSRAYPEKAILNLDIGGGTTNLAVGRAGEVLATGCLLVGARHIQVVPGGYVLVRVSPYARGLLDSLSIHKGPGECLETTEVDAVLDFCLQLLEAAVVGKRSPFDTPVGRLHEQVPFHIPRSVGELAVTISGGVGELVYAHLQGKGWPPTTHFGDLGIDLARRIVASRLWHDSLRTYRPASAGRATVYGLLRHSTEVSGSTLFLPCPDVLPLADLPILGTLDPGSDDARLRYVLDLIRRSAPGGCVQVATGGLDAAGVRSLGTRIACVLQETSFPADRPLVILVRENIGKVLGHYVTDWGKLRLNVVVIDEVAPRNAQYTQIGSLRSQVVPVFFYGLNE